MKKNKIKLKLLYILPAVICLAAALFFGFQNKMAVGESKNMAYNLDNYGKYAGTNDTKDGIVLSACESSITSPAEGVILWHNSDIPFSSQVVQYGGAYVETGYTALWGSQCYWNDYSSGLPSFSGKFAPGHHSVFLYDYYPYIPGNYDPNLAITCNPAQCANGFFCECCQVNFDTGWYLATGLYPGSENTGWVDSTPFTTDRCGQPPKCADVEDPIRTMTTDGRIVKNGTWVALLAHNWPGYAFKRWHVSPPGGPCDGSTDPTCSAFQMLGDYAIQAEFEEVDDPPLICDCGDKTQRCTTDTWTDNCGNPCQGEKDCSIPGTGGTGSGWKEVAP